MIRHKVLIPLDGSAFSKQILPVICDLFQPEAYELVLLQVAPPALGMIDVPSPHFTGVWPHTGYSTHAMQPEQHTITASQMEENMRGELQDEMQREKYRLEELGYRVSTVIRFGDPAQEIVDFADTEAVNLVAMATHGRTGFAHVLLGSVAERVLRRLTIPVLMLRPGDLT